MLNDLSLPQVIDIIQSYKLYNQVILNINNILIQGTDLEGEPLSEESLETFNSINLAAQTANKHIQNLGIPKKWLED